MQDAGRIRRRSTISHETRPTYLLEQVDDAAVVQYYADGFDGLPLDQKILAWHLYQAALAGRDIYYDQRYRHALEMREMLEEILTHVDAGPIELASVARRDPPLHEAVLDQLRAAQHHHGAQVRAEVPPAELARRRGDAAERTARRFRVAPARRSRRCSSGCTGRSSIPTSIRW